MKGVEISDVFFNNTSYSIIFANKDKKITNVNKAFENIVGYSEQEVLMKDLNIIKSELHDASFYKNMWETVDAQGIWEGELWNRRKNGELYLAKRTIILNTQKEDSFIKYIIFGRDITNEKENEKKVKDIHYKDYITLLPDKHVFDEILSSAIKRAKKKKRKMAIIILDIQRFRNINNTFGYIDGDNLLRQVAKRLQSILSDDAVLSRMGGDLFIALLPSLQNEKEAIDTLEILTTSFNEEHFVLNDQKIPLHLNIGVSFHPEDGKTGQDLIAKADLARYRVKENNTHGYQFYTPELNVMALEKLTLESSLRKAVERNEFVLYYQPQALLESNVITGVEALIRWNHPEFGLVPPNKFISLAEETGLIIDIGAWVIKEACAQLAAWSKKGFNLTMGLNLSPLQFQDENLINTIKKALEETKINPTQLELEITESIMVEDVEKSIQTLNQIKEMGINISIDDFGTGYSSLSYLAKFPIDFLKIDRSFMRNVSDNPLNSTIASAIIAMAKGLNLAVVAEGVEYEEQLEFLRKENCEYFQGYYLSSPIPAAEMENFILEYNKNKTS